MADTVDTKVIRNGPRYYVARFQNQSDGTGETNVAKVTTSALTTWDGKTCTYTTIERIEYAIQGFTQVRLHWDHTTNDEIATLSGSGVIDLSSEGGMTDPKSAGDAGNILLTTVSPAAGASYDITIWLRKKA